MVMIMFICLPLYVMKQVYLLILQKIHKKWKIWEKVWLKILKRRVDRILRVIAKVN
jgi:hypothetical protein